MNARAVPQGRSAAAADAVSDAEDAAQLERLGYAQELNRVLSPFDNFSIAFSWFSRPARCDARAVWTWKASRPARRAAR